MKRILTALMMAFTLFVTSGGLSFAQNLQKGAEAVQKGDYETALREWRPLAEQGNAIAQFNLGHLYRQGLGVTQDSREAVKWYRKSAEQGYANAQSNLGLMYAKGQGVIQDYQYAHLWWNIAASAGDTNAMVDRDKLAKEMSAADISKAQELAQECVRKSYKGC